MRPLMGPRFLAGLGAALALLAPGIARAWDVLASACPDQPLICERGHVVFDQGGSAGGSDPRRLRVYGLAGARPDITTKVLPLGRVGSPYSFDLDAVQAPGPFSW